MAVVSDMEHRMDMNPRAVYDEDGADNGLRLGYVSTCTCGVGVFGGKDEVWELLAGHMVMTDPLLRAAAVRFPRHREVSDG